VGTYIEDVDALSVSVFPSLFPLCLSLSLNFSLSLSRSLSLALALSLLGDISRVPPFALKRLWVGRYMEVREKK
jgi:hypothetical protein